MKYLYSFDFTDTVSANSENQAIKAWEQITGESIDDYPNMDVRKIPCTEWVTLWNDIYCKDFRVSKMASKWARETERPKLVCSTEY
jgi:hypothetical protein